MNIIRIAGPRSVSIDHMEEDSCGNGCVKLFWTNLENNIWDKLFVQFNSIGGQETTLEFTHMSETNCEVSGIPGASLHIKMWTERYNVSSEVVKGAYPLSKWKPAHSTRNQASRIESQRLET